MDGVDGLPPPPLPPVAASMPSALASDSEDSVDELIEKGMRRRPSAAAGAAAGGGGDYDGVDFGIVLPPGSVGRHSWNICDYLPLAARRWFIILVGGFLLKPLEQSWGRRRDAERMRMGGGVS